MLAGAGATRGGPVRSSVPWWVVTCAAAFLGYYALLIYSDIGRPAAAGVTLRVDASGLMVQALVPGSPADRAGLRVGDRVRAANGHAIRTRPDWQAVGTNLRIDQPVHLVIERDAQEHPIELVLPRVHQSYWATPSGATLVAARSVQVVTLALALLVAAQRPRDPAARVGAWALATLSVYSLVWPSQIAAIWRELPAPVGAALWLPFASSLAPAAIIFTFAASFPRPLIRSPWMWLAAWAPMVPSLFLQLQFAWLVVYRPEQASGFGTWTPLHASTTAGYAAAALAMFVVGYRRAPDATDRRRVRVLLVGSLVGLISILLAGAGYWLSDISPGESVLTSPLVGIGVVLAMLLPASFAYAILRHRLFDITVMVRQGLQYALARRLLLSVVPAMVTVLLVDLWISRHASLTGILLERGWLYLTLAGLALVAGLRRGHWLAALDRRFFRDQYNAHRTLRSLTEEVRASERFDLMAPRVVGWVAGALHVDLVSLLMRHGGEQVFRPVAIHPGGADVPALRADDRIVQLLQLLQTPIQVPSHDGNRLVRQLPREELETLRRSGIELLVPVGSGDGAPAVLLALGPKRSEEPYTTEDEDLLVALADSLALLLSRTRSDTTEVCPVCGVCYDAGSGTCPSDEATLSALLLPRSLGGRYRLTRRVGRGGMGTVYSATDTALDRPVAVKVLHEELVSGGDLMPRLRTEAQLLAGLVHPNIVTIHDLGVTASGRGFLVMELLEGVTLREELRRTGPMPLSRVLHILRGVGAAIDAAHARQIVHRDLKPENIRLCPGQTGEIPKVLDFGVARALETRPGAPITAAGMVAGTPPYMAPEHLRGGEPSPDWDLWAFATIAFELIADRLPATLAADADRFAAVPAGLHPIFSRALSAHPINRPTSAAELIDELDRLLAQV
jgi:hypothetical protein